MTLDDILSLFDPQHAAKLPGLAEVPGAPRSPDAANSSTPSFATFEPFVEHANQLVSLLATQEGAVRELVHNTGVVFQALSGRDHQLRRAITNGEHTFHAAASASHGVRARPSASCRGSSATRSWRCARSTSSRWSPAPICEEVKPAERSLQKLLKAAKPFTPQFNDFLTALGPLSKAAKKGLPSFKKVLDLTVPRA